MQTVEDAGSFYATIPYNFIFPTPHEPVLAPVNLYFW